MDQGAWQPRVRATPERSVLAHVNYLGGMSERPKFHVYDRARDNLRLEPHHRLIRNARAQPTAPTIDDAGFQLVEFRSQVKSFTSRKQLLMVYRREIEDLIRSLTGAAKVVAEPLGVVRVNTRASDESANAAHAPVRFVHIDHTPRSALDVIRRLVPSECDEFGPRRPCALYSVWRSLTPPPQDTPLAVCDTRSIATEDSVSADTILDWPGSRAGTVEATLLRFNTSHRWYYFPAMTSDEVLVFKAFDSDQTRPGGVPHVAFDDPNCPSDVTPRRSLDVRAVAIF